MTRSAHGIIREHSANSALDPRIIAVSRDALALEVFGSVTSRAVAPTATAIAELLGADREPVARRLEALERWSLVERVSHAPSEPAYRATRDALLSDEEWAQLHPADRRSVLTPVLEMITARIWSAFDRGGFDAPDVHVSRMAVDLDDEGYEAMVRLGAEVLERAREIQAAVVQRRAEGTSDTRSIKSELVFMHFLRDVLTPAGPSPDDALERAFAASEDVCDALADEEPDWHALAVRARELATLAERLGAAPLANAVR